MKKKGGETMAGAQTTLSLQDKLTGPLTKMMKALDNTIKVMERMDQSASNLDTRGLANARRSIDNASADLARLSSAAGSAGDSADRAANQQRNFNDSVNGGLPGIGSLATKLLSVVGAYKALSAAKSFLKDMFSQGIEFNTFKQASESAFTIFLGDAEKAKKYMDDMYAFALTTPFGFPDLLESSRNMIAFGIEADNTFAILQAIGDNVAMDANKNASMASMADIFGMIQVKGKLTMMEVQRLGKHGVSAIDMLAEAAGVSGEEISKQISKGTIGAGFAISTLVEGMQKASGGLMAKVKGTLIGSLDSLRSSIRNAGATMMEAYTAEGGPLVNLIGNISKLIKKIPEHIGPAVAAFLPLISVLSETLDAGAFDHFFSAVGAGLTTLAWIASGLGMAVLKVAQFFNDNWSIIEPILIPIGTALAIITGILIAKYAWLGLIKTATLAWKAAQWAVNAAYLANPIGLILLVIVSVNALIIYAMYEWETQTATVIGLIVGSIYWLGAALQNVMIFIGNMTMAVVEYFYNTWNQGFYNVQMLWLMFNMGVRMILDAIGNAVLKAAEWFVNTWNKAGYGVEMVFYAFQKIAFKVVNAVASGVQGVVNSVLGSISGLINGAVSGLNQVIGMINNIPGVSISAIGTVDLSIGNKLTDFTKDFMDPGSAPTAPKNVSLGRMNTAGDYANNLSTPTAPEKANFGRMEYNNLTQAFIKGTVTGGKASLAASSKLSEGINKLTGLVKGGEKEGPLNAGELPTGDLAGMANPLGGGNDKLAKKKNPTGGKLDKVGKIEKEINIADEDLKMLRDLAEIKSIQNIITLTPQVTFGDTTVREEADIDKIVKKITTAFEEDMSRSAEGVYT